MPGLTEKKLQGLPPNVVEALLDETSVQALSGAGAVNLTTAITRFTSTGGAQALTLADGSIVGQRKRIYHAVDGGSGVLTAGGALHLGDSIATITLTAKGDWVELQWNGSAWDVIGLGGTTALA